MKEKRPKVTPESNLISEKFKEAREVVGLSQHQFANKLIMPRCTIQMAEQGLTAYTILEQQKIKSFLLKALDEYIRLISKTKTTIKDINSIKC